MKASLNLSVNAIVVFVLAFALLSAGLFFTNMIRETITERTFEAINVNELENPPTSDKPITIPGNVLIKKGKQRDDITVGFYNRDNTAKTGVTLTVGGCLDSTGAEPPCIAAGTCSYPTLASGAEDVGSAEAIGFPIILTENDMPIGKYICKVQAKDDTGTVLEKKSFILEVGS